MRDGLQVIGETHAVWSRAQSSPASPFAIATFLSYIAFFFFFFNFLWKAIYWGLLVF